jgi:uncharacterized protein (DUF362 family)
MSGHTGRSLRERFGARHISILIGLSALGWVLFRTGRKPSRIVYPCQKAALSTSWLFLGLPVAGFITSRRWSRPALWITGIALCVLAVAFLGVPALRTSGAEVSASALTAQAERIPDWVAKGRAFNGRVVHVHDPAATSWDFTAGWYGDFVDQDVVTAMVTEGLLALTGTQTLQGAWQALIPDFQPGEKLAIKVNFNNVSSDPPTTNRIDAIIEPVNGLLGGLIDYGFEPSDITVFDVTRSNWNFGIVPQRFVDGCDFPGVSFVEWVSDAETFSDTAFLHFDPPAGTISDRPLANCVVEADYLISMPIGKAHDYAGVSLAFKNHFGSFMRCDYLHNHVFQSGAYWSADYNPLVELFLNHHIGGKTILTVTDCLYGNWEHLNTPPTPWPSFGDDAPNSIFLGTDVVAVDCVVTDVLAVEGSIPADADQYLVLASAAGLGVYERAVSPGVYSVIDYVHLEAPFDGTGIDAGHAAASRGAIAVAPNPSAGSAVVHLTLSDGLVERGTVRLYDVRGRLVRTLLENEPIDDGRELVWDGKDDTGTRVASGVYWCSLDSGGRRETARVVLVR